MTDLIEAINGGSPRDAEAAATFLARTRTELSLGLANEQKQAGRRPNTNSLE